MSRSWASLAGAALLAATCAQGAQAATRHENALFGYTHLLPSPYTMKAGRLSLGTEGALGITDFLQVSTNILSDFYQVYNASAKVSLVDYYEFAMGLTFGWESYNYHNVSPLNPDLQVTSLLPGVITAFAITEDLAIFGGANLNYTSSALATSGIDTSGYVMGARVESDLSWAYNPKKKGIGNVLSAGASYDLTYSILGLGLSHHWPGFHAGLHYYPNASQYKVQPILAGSAAVDF